MQKTLFISFMLLAFNLLFTDVVAQTIVTYEDFMRVYEKDLEKVKEGAPIDCDALGKKAVDAIGVLNIVKTFMETLPKSREYEPVIQHIKLQIQYNRGPLTGRYEKIVEVYGRHKASDQLALMSKALTNLARAAAVYTIIDAVSQGTDEGNFKAMVATYKLLHGELLSAAGLSYIGLAVAPIDYALTTFMSNALESNENLVYASYVYFLNKRYSKEQLWSLYKARNFTELNRRLIDEFWADSDTYLGEYMQEMRIGRDIIDRTGRLDANPKTKKEFAYSYYQTYLKRYIDRELQKVKFEDMRRLEGIMIGELADAKKRKAEAEQLKADLEEMKREMNEKVAYTKDSIDFIKIIPQEMTIGKGESIEMKVRAYLKNGKSTFITDKCELPAIDFNVAGKKQVVVNCEGKRDETTWSVVVDPKLEIIPGEYRFDINDSDKQPAFVVTFTDKYEISTDVTSDAFSGLSVHPNSADYDNPKEYPIYAQYGYEGRQFFADAVVIVSGCADPDRTIDQESGECKCDNDRGYFEADDGECSAYSSIYLNPETIKGKVGDKYIIEVIGIDGSGNQIVIIELEVQIEVESRKVYNMSQEGYALSYTLIGSACANERMEQDVNGDCKCKPEFIPDGENCRTIEELEQETKEDGGGEDVNCDSLISVLQMQYATQVPVIKSKVAIIVDHAELALNLLNDTSIDPCNNVALINSKDIIKRESEDLEAIKQGLLVGLVEEWGNGGLVCPDMIFVEEELLLIITEEINEAQKISSILEAEWLEFNCKEEDVDDQSPDLTQDPSRNPSGNLSGASGSNFPDGGTGGTIIGEENDDYVQCLSAKGYTPSSIEPQMMELNAEWMIAAEAYAEDTDNEALCNNYKNACIQIRDFIQIQVDCWIESGIENYPNGQQLLGSAQQSISYWNGLINSLFC